MALTFRCLAILGVLAFLACAGFGLHAVTHWYFWSGK